MALIFFQILTLACSDRAIEYRLSKNFGETFHDYSENFRDAINGNRIGADDQDTLPSDRGAYFCNSRSMIIIPETDLNNKKIEFSTPYSIVIWTNLLKYDDVADSIGISSSVIKRFGANGNEISLSINSDMSLDLEVLQVEDNNSESSSSSKVSISSSNNSRSSDLGSSNSSSSDSSDSSSLNSSDSSSSNSSSSDSSDSSSSNSSSSDSSDSSSLNSSDSSSSDSSDSSSSNSSSSDSSDSSSSDSSSSDSSDSSSSDSSSSNSSDSDSSDSSSLNSSDSSSSDSSDSSSSNSSDSSSSNSSDSNTSGSSRLRQLVSISSSENEEFPLYSSLFDSLSFDPYYFDSSEIMPSFSQSDLDNASSYNKENEAKRILTSKKRLSDTLIQNGTWTLIRLAIDKNSIQIFINEVSQGTQVIDSYSEVNQNYLTYIGGSPNTETSINGFVWNLAVDYSFMVSDYIPQTSLDCEFAYYEDGEYKCFPTELDLRKNLYSQNCPSTCSSCDSYLRCLDCKCQVSSCEIQQASILCICPSGSTATETTCTCSNSQYFTGTQCKDCQIENCSECLNSNTCIKCDSGFIVNNGKCECPIGEYKTQAKCQKCIENCDSCSQSTRCKTCSAGFYLDFKGKCQQCGEKCRNCNEEKCIECELSYELKTGSKSDCTCPVGYKDYGKCELKRFSAQSFVSNDNIVTVYFNESLNRYLNYSDFFVEVNDVRRPSVTFTVMNSAEYQFAVNSEYDILKGTVFNVSLKDEYLYSTEFSLFYATDLAVELFETPASNPSAETLKNSIKSVVVSLFSITALSALLVNPTFFWILINTLQILTYLPLNSTPYPKTLREFFINVNYLNIIPSLTKIMKIDMQKVPPYLEARQYDIENALFLVNIDAIVVQFLFNIIFIPILMLGEKIFNGKVGTMCSKYLKNYQYAYFLKLLTGIYMDFLIYSLIQLRTTSSDVFGVINAGAALLVLAILILSPLATLIFSFQTRAKIVDLNDQDFHGKWGSLYDEFKNNKGFLSTQFYSLFMIRRLFYGFGQVFLNSNLYLLSAINIIGTLLVFCYNIQYFPFRHRGVNICCLLEEGAIFITMVLSLAFFTDANIAVKKKIEVGIMIVVFASILLQVLICLVMMIIELKKKLSNKTKTVVVPQGAIDGKGCGNDTSAVVHLNSDHFENEEKFIKVNSS